MQQTSARRALFEFAFVSRLALLEERALARLVGAAWASNIRNGVTGVMRLDGLNLCQIVEGEAETILPLAARILADRRHSRVEVTAFGEIGRRRFGAWHVEGLQRPPLPPALRERPIPLVEAGPADLRVPLRTA